MYRFLKFQQYYNQDIDDKFLPIFRDTRKTPLKYVQLRNCSVTDAGMRILLNHNLVSLSMWYCTAVTRATWSVLIEHGRQLKSLELGKQVDLLKYSEPLEKISLEPPFQLDLPNLQKLVLNGVVFRPETRFDHLINLKHLDLTACILVEFSLEVLIALPNLQTLILFNVWPLEQEIPTLCRLKQLRTLDMSIAKSNINGNYSQPNRQLTELVENLPYLTHLDISGTNLAGNGVAQALKTRPDENMRGSDIPGLASRVERPLQFLGLYNTSHSACRRYDIPALTVSFNCFNALRVMGSTYNFFLDRW